MKCCFCQNGQIICTECQSAGWLQKSVPAGVSMPYWPTASKASKGIKANAKPPHVFICPNCSGIGTIPCGYCGGAGLIT